MILKPQASRRRAASTVEAAIVLPIAFFLLLGILVGAMAVSAYQEVAHVARETARFASVHGGQYAKQNSALIQNGKLPVVDKAYLINYALSRAAGLDVSQLQVTVTITTLVPGADSASKLETVDWDNITENQNRSPYSTWTNSNATPPTNIQLDNMVTVQITYPWTTGLLGLGPINLTSTSIMPISY